MKFEEFKNKIEQLYTERFGKSFCRCRIYRCLGKNITIDCRLAENLNECPHNIADNDMMRICLSIMLPDGWDDTVELPENMIMEAWQNSILVKPKTGYLYCEHKKVSYRKTKGNAEKMIAAFGKFVDRLYNLIKEEYHAENLLDYDMALITKKEYFKA